MKNFPRADLLVNGAGLAGIAAALTAARSGRRVLLLESTIHPVWDWTETLQLCQPRSAVVTLAELLQTDPGAFAEPGPGEKVFLHPCRLKIRAEDALLAAGVELLYASAPYAWEWNDGELRVWVSSKSGAFHVSCRSMIDASQEARFAPAFSAPVLRRVAAPAIRFLEFTGVQMEELPETLADPQCGLLITAPASRQAGHLSVGFTPANPWSGKPGTLHETNAQAVREAQELAARLLADLPAFRSAKIATIASLEVVPPVRYFATVHSFFQIAGPAGIEDLPLAEKLAADPVALMNHATALASSAPEFSASSALAGHLPQTNLETEVLVVGAGTCGASAAIAVAEAGASVVAAEMHSGMGGIGTLGGINSYWFARRVAHNKRLTLAVRDLEDADGYAEMPHWKMKMWPIEKKKQVLHEMAQRAGVTPLLQHRLVSPLLENNKVIGALLLGPDHLMEVRARLTIDATGDGDLAAAAGADYLYGAKRTHSTMWFTLSWCAKPGTFRSNFTSQVDIRDPRDYTRAILAGRRRGQEPWDHAPYLALRESRHIRGVVWPTLTDQLRRRQWPDTIEIAYSNHDVKGYTESEWLRIGLIPPNLEIEIPYRALVPAHLDGLLLAGKAISGSAEALPAIRMQADFENLGYAIGLAAARCVQNNVAPRHLEVRPLQEELVRRQQLPASFLTRKLPAPDHSAERIRLLIDALRDDSPLTRYQDMEMGEKWREEIPFVELCVIGQAAIPQVYAEFLRPGSPRRRMCALILAWNGDSRARAFLETTICELLADGPGLPEISHPVRYAHPSPDQGNMPEVAYLLNALSFIANRDTIGLLADIVARLQVREEAFRQASSGIFDYVDAICAVASRIAHPDLLPPLRTLHQKPCLAGNLFQGRFEVDYFSERRAFLEVQIAEALARCGDIDGCRLLTRFQEDSRRPIANAARAVLRDLGLADGAPPEPSRADIDDTPNRLPCQPRPRYRDGTEGIVWEREPLAGQAEAIPRSPL
jgi:hypothetical protein